MTTMDYSLKFNLVNGRAYLTNKKSLRLFKGVLH